MGTYSPKLMDGSALPGRLILEGCVLQSTCDGEFGNVECLNVMDGVMYFDTTKHDTFYCQECYDSDPGLAESCTKVDSLNGLARCLFTAMGGELGSTVTLDQFLEYKHRSDPIQTSDLGKSKAETTKSLEALGFAEVERLDMDQVKAFMLQMLKSKTHAANIQPKASEKPATSSLPLSVIGIVAVIAILLP